MSDPILYKAVDALYNRAVSVLPEAVRDRPMAAAFAFGSLGSFGVVCGAINGLRWLSERLVPGFDAKYFSWLERAVIAGAAAAPFLYALADPAGAHEVMTRHPVYTSGMAGVAAGIVSAAALDLYVSRRNPELEALL